MRPLAAPPQAATSAASTSYTAPVLRRAVRNPMSPTYVASDGRAAGPATKKTPPPPTSPRPPARFTSRPRLRPPRRPLDTTLAWGDCVALLCTQLASEDIPIAEAGALGSIMVVCFVAVAAAKGDYGGGGDGAAALDVWSRRRAMVRALAAAGTTWGVAVGATLVGDALLLRCHAVSPTAFLAAGSVAASAAASNGAAGVVVGAAGAVAGAGVAGHGAPPISDVLVSALVTLCSWRGIYAGLRGILL